MLHHTYINNRETLRRNIDSVVTDLSYTIP